jgi:hypothetical protein
MWATGKLQCQFPPQCDGQNQQYSEEENSSSSRTLMPHVLLEQRWQPKTASLEVSVSFNFYL